MGTGGGGFGGDAPRGFDWDRDRWDRRERRRFGRLGRNPCTDSGTTSTAGGEGAGGGGDLTIASPPSGGPGAIPVSGGSGGFGGGGGAGIGANNKGGNGGFGGGGGAGLTNARDGIPGASAANGTGGWGGGDGALINGGIVGLRSIGGGGAGFGGAVFLLNGSLTLHAVTFTNNSAVGGTGGTNGQGKGGALFIIDNATSGTPDTNFAVDFGSTYTGNTAAQAGIGGIGSSDPMFISYVLGQPCPNADTANICGFVYQGTLHTSAGTPQSVTTGETLSPLEATVQLPSNVPSTFLVMPDHLHRSGTGASATFAGGAIHSNGSDRRERRSNRPRADREQHQRKLQHQREHRSLNAQFAITNNAQQSQTITFNPIPTQTQGTTPEPDCEASSGLTVSFTSQTSAVCTVSGTTANFIAGGRVPFRLRRMGTPPMPPQRPFLKALRY